MASLIELNLAENEIASVKDMRNLPCLKKLVLDTNKLESLDDFPNLPSLEFLDIQNNTIERDGELPKLGHLRKLHTLNAAGCPFADEKGDGFKIDVLIFLDMLKVKVVNDDEVTEEDHIEAKEVKAERIQQAKEAAEEAAREAAEREAERLAALEAEEREAEMEEGQEDE